VLAEVDVAVHVVVVAAAVMQGWFKALTKKFPGGKVYRR